MNFVKAILLLGFLISFQKTGLIGQKHSGLPNIVLINVDDLGWKDISGQKGSYYETPHIDALIAEGIHFTNAYASASNCAPSRASMLSGLWPQRHGIYTVGTSKRGASKNRKLIPVENVNILGDSFYTIPEALKGMGYQTVHAGKWHITDNPCNQGFDVNVGGSNQGHPGSYYPPYRNIDLSTEPGKRLSDRIMDVLLDTIQRIKPPFFIHYAPYAVHTPIQAVPELILKYESKKSLIPQLNVAYGTMVENIDSNIGRLTEFLRENQLFDQCLIIFTSDNGGLFSVSDQRPLRAGKGSYFEGGIRVPFAFIWKNFISSNQQANEIVSQLDIFPTILSLLNQEMKYKLDGQDISKILFNRGPVEGHDLFWHFPIYLESIKGDTENHDAYFRTRPGSVIRSGDFKLHYYYEDSRVELYNLKNDPGEKRNLANDLPVKTNELKEKLKTWLQVTHAPVDLSNNPDFIP